MRVTDSTQSEGAKTPPLSRIVLTGFMGSGKSTIGPLLARRLGWSFVDVDQQIEAEAGVTIAELFAREGEAAFRALEEATVARLCAGERLVLALGGGAIESEATRRLLTTTSGTVLVHLEITLATALTRCRGTEQTRPLLADRAKLEERFLRRLPLYRVAHISVASSGRKPSLVADEILCETRMNCG